jgi:hypothetical protein
MEHIQTFASLETSELLPILGIFTGMLISFYALVKYLINQAEKANEGSRAERMDDKKAEREERVALAEAFNRVATATEKSANEAEARNGHLADISVENKNQILTAISGLTIDKQTVHNQFVENEQVNHKEG